jgi:hypothetical protein
VNAAEFSVDGPSTRWENLLGALTARALNLGAADAKALDLCGEGCTIELRFQGTEVCGVLATSGNGHFGVVSGNSRASANAAARGLQ